jgi:hypothetical protein
MLKVETNNAETLTKQLAEGISFLKDTRNSLKSAKEREVKEKKKIAELTAKNEGHNK